MPSSDVNAHVFHEQGSTKFTAIAGGEIEMQSGSLLDIQSGSTMRFAKGAYITSLSMTTHGTTEAASEREIPGYGYSHINTSSSNTHWHLSHPYIGVQKWITIGRSSKVVVVKCTECGIGSTLQLVLKFKPTSKTTGVGMGIGLMGVSTNLYRVLAMTPSSAGTNWGIITITPTT